MAKYVLETNFDYDFSLLAISAHEADYKLCIQINSLLNINLSRQESVELSNKNTATPLSFACFSYQNEDDDGEYILLSNKSSNTVASRQKDTTPSLFEDDKRTDVKGSLVPELPQADYIFLLKTDNHQMMVSEVQGQLKSINFVLSVQKINPETLASKKNLII